MTRRRFFSDLTKSIFGKENIKFIDDNSKIALGGNQVSETKFNIAAQQKFTNIFNAAYSGMTIQKNTSGRSDKIETIKMDDLIQNSILYFQSIGIVIDNKRLDSVYCNVKRKMFREAITHIILPFIFDGSDPDKNAESEFKQVVSSLKSYFRGFELGYIVHSHATANDVEAIFDDECKKYSKDRYAVPIDRRKVERDIIRVCPIAEVRIKVNNKTDSEESVLESIVKRLQKYPFSIDEPFIDPFALELDYSLDNTLNYKIDSCFPLSNIDIPTQLFIPRFFYYVIPINESTVHMYENTYLNKKGDNKKTNEDVEEPKEYNEKTITDDDESKEDNEKTIADAEEPKEDNEKTKEKIKKLDYDSFFAITEKRAVEKFRSVYRCEITEYYYHVIKYIKDMFERITTIDYSNAIRKDSSDVEACQNFVNHFNMEYEKLIQFIEDEDCVLKCYDLIEHALYSFALSFENAIPILTKELCHFLSCEVLSHYDAIGEYLKSEQLSEAIKLKKALLKETAEKKEVEEKKSKTSATKGDTNKEKKNDNTNSEAKNKNPYEEARRLWYGLDKIGYTQENIYQRILDVLKKYHDTLGAEMGSNKQ